MQLPLNRYIYNQVVRYIPTFFFSLFGNSRTFLSKIQLCAIMQIRMLSSEYLSYLKSWPFCFFIIVIIIIIIIAIRHY